MCLCPAVCVPLAVMVVFEVPVGCVPLAVMVVFEVPVGCAPLAVKCMFIPRDICYLFVTVSFMALK